MDGTAQEGDAENVGEELQEQDVTDMDRSGVYDTEEVCQSFSTFLFMNPLPQIWLYAKVMDVWKVGLILKSIIYVSSVSFFLTVIGPSA